MIPPCGIFTIDDQVGHFAPFRNEPFQFEDVMHSLIVRAVRTGPALCGHDLAGSVMGRTWAPTYGSTLLASRPLVTMCEACEQEAMRLLATERRPARAVRSRTLRRRSS